MSINLTLSTTGIISSNSYSKFTPKRELKGQHLESIVSDYFIIDIETTGLDPNWNEIIELAAIKYENHIPVAEFSSLVKPDCLIDDFIQNLTGITNKMLEDEQSIDVVLPKFLSFIGDSAVIGHNVNFDINFIYDSSIEFSERPFQNDFLDTMRLSRRLFPQLENHKLKTLVKSFDVSNSVAHRALKDCQLTHSCLVHMLNHMNENNIETTNFFRKSNHKDKLKSKDICAITDNFDKNHPFFGKTFAFTGVLEKMQRKDAMQIVVDLGGLCGDGVTKKTNFLVLGNNDFCSSIKDGKSSKHKKAENYILEGQDLSVISENVFYDMIED